MAPAWHGEIALGGSAAQIAVGQNANGALHIFYIGVNGDLYHNWQLARGTNNWAGETKFAGDIATQITVAQNFGGELEIFYVGTNGQLYHNRQTAPNSLTWIGETEFATFNNSFNHVKQVAVVQSNNGFLWIFYIGDDNGLYYDVQTAPGGMLWHGQLKLSTEYIWQSVSIGQFLGGELLIFLTWNPGSVISSMWQALTGIPVWVAGSGFGLQDSAKQISTGLNTDGTAEFFYVGTNNDLYHNREIGPNTNQWIGETHFQTASAKQVVVAQNKSGAQEIFYIGTNNSLYHNWQTTPSSTAWAGETSFSGDSANMIAVGKNWDERLEIFYVGINFKIYHNWQMTAG